MKPPCFLGIDLGTSSVKVVLTGLKGEILAVSSRSYPVYSPQSGWAEQDPAQWWQAVSEAVREVIGPSKIDPAQVKAVGMSGQTHGTVVLDKGLQPLNGAIIWMDRRSIPQINRLKKEDKIDFLSQIAGIPPACGFMAFTLLWLRENKPEIWEKAAKFLLPKDYLRLRLTGELATDVTDAGGTFLLDVRRRAWSSKILEELEIPPSYLPSLYESTEITGTISREASGQTLLPVGIPVAAGGADQIMGAIGNAIIENDVGACILGTGGQFITSLDKCLIKPQVGLHTFPHALPGKWIHMGAILSGAMSFDWYCRQILRLNTRQVEKKLSLVFLNKKEVSAHKGKLLFLPYLGGERTPYLDPLARGVFVGLTLEHTGFDLALAVMEGVTLAMRNCLEIFKQSGVKLSGLVSSGGGAKSKLWRQIQADVFNLPILTLNSREQSAYGASLTAAVATGFFSSVEEACQEWIKEVDRIEPVPERVKKYDQLYPIFAGLYSHLKEDFHSLSQLSS